MFDGTVETPPDGVKRTAGRAGLCDHRVKMSDAPELIAFYAGAAPELPLEPAPRRRGWMDEETRHWANRCLPLLVANEAGWVIRNPHAFTATWNGGPSRDDVDIDFDEEPARVKPYVRSFFGYGVVTWGVPYLFRTAAGVNLLVRGPANAPKDGVAPLEGIVETDWSTATFTMNWKLTRPGLPVRFEAGEPFCMLVPQPRGMLEAYRPTLRSFDDDPATKEATARWIEGRDAMHRERFVAEHVPGADVPDWEGAYYRGTQPDGTPAPEHQTRIRLAPFSLGSLR